MKKFILISLGIVTILLGGFYLYIHFYYKPHYTPYTIDGPAMLPTYKAGQVVTTRKGSADQLKRGDIVIFKRTNLQGNEVTLLKRVVGLPGDTVTIKEGSLIVSKPDGTTYIPYNDKDTPGSQQLTFEPNYFYVVGDNRSNSLDSRAFGPLLLEGQVIVVRQ